MGGWQLGSDRDLFPRDTQAKARGELNPRGAPEGGRGSPGVLSRGQAGDGGTSRDPRAHTSGFGSQQEPAAGNNWVLEVRISGQQGAREEQPPWGRGEGRTHRHASAFGTFGNFAGLFSHPTLPDHGFFPPRGISCTPGMCSEPGQHRASSPTPRMEGGTRGDTAGLGARRHLRPALSTQRCRWLT